ncbi:MAG TPA: glycosyltransferase family 87 protein [Candidatus Limnocylindria bacterium]
MTLTRLAGAYALVALIVAVVFAAAILGGPFRAVERSDYMTYHVAARIVLAGDGACLYDAGCQATVQRELIGEEPSFESGALPFNSPPWLAALVAPLGVLPLGIGFAIFTALGVALLAWGTWRAAAGHVGWGGPAARALAVVLVLTAWPTVMAVIRGQSTLLVAGLLGLSVGMARYRSGLMLGLSVLKPTLGPIWALWQLVGGHRRAVGTALLVALALVALAAVVASPQSLVDYPQHLYRVAGLDAPGVHVEEMINWRGAALRLGAGAWLQAAGTAITLAGVGWTWWRTRSRHLGAAAAFLATPLVIPHANQHEFVLASIGIVMVVAAAGDRRVALASLAIAAHAILWAGPVMEATASAWMLFGACLVWLAIAAVLAGRAEAGA